ncbi:thioredoxin fold domain-containing protein [Acidithiobacillus ferrivorans]|nr:thioredoxin fold domain-containing protein [Acidithiobacillus ferrivorans]
MVYDFFDPNCYYCPAPYKMEQQFIQEGKLTVRYVPVGFLTPSSLGKSAAILEAPNPPVALAVDMEGVVQNGTGGVLAIDPDAVARAGLAVQPLDAHRTGVDIVPDLVFRLPDGHVGMIKGVFPDSVLRDIVHGRMP